MEHNQTTDQYSVIGLPSAYFLWGSSELPKGTKAKDIYYFVEDCISNESCIPLEHLYWGYLVSKKKEKVSYFYTYRRKVDEHLKGLDLRKVGLVLPFASLFSMQNDVLGSQFHVVEDKCQSKIGLDGHGLIAVINSEYSHQRNDRERSLEDPQKRISDIGVSISKKGNLNVTYSDQVSSRLKTFKHSLSSFETADIRDQELLKEIKTERKSAYFVQVMSSVCLAMLIFFAVYQLIALTIDKEAEETAQRVEANSKAVKQIQEKERVIKLLRVFSEESFRPFDWIMFINYARPENMSFRSIKLDVNKHILISGVTDLVEEANSFLSLLETTEQFMTLEMRDLKSRSGRVEFLIELSTKSGKPDIEAAKSKLQVEGVEG